MSDDWAAGDQALCISSAGWYDPFNGDDSNGPDLGSVHQVQGVSQWFLWGREILALRFSPWPIWYQASCFRKVTPGADIQGSEIERERFKQGNPWKVPA